jgi:hypothetical protein
VCSGGGVLRHFGASLALQCPCQVKPFQTLERLGIDPGWGLSGLKSSPLGVGFLRWRAAAYVR